MQMVLCIMPICDAISELFTIVIVSHYFYQICSYIMWWYHQNIVLVLHPTSMILTFKQERPMPYFYRNIEFLVSIQTSSYGLHFHQ